MSRKMAHQLASANPCHPETNRVDPSRFASPPEAAVLEFIVRKGTVAGGRGGNLDLKGLSIEPRVQAAGV